MGDERCVTCGQARDYYQHHDSRSQWAHVFNGPQPAPEGQTPSASWGEEEDVKGACAVLRQAGCPESAKRLQSLFARLRAELEAEQQEGLEQARLHGVGANREAKLRAALEEARRRIATLDQDRHYWAHLTYETDMRRIAETKRAEKAEADAARLREEVRTTLLAEEERRKLTGDALAAEAEAARWAARCIAVLHDDLSAADRYEWEREAAALAAEGAGKRGGE